jgi:predicted hotdog family 3-hydroxylacyl-ACP dehydratase/3-hydroxymyristoyl/3-hydroxydecanoyl-(acyl carrier protein) dehydratase
VAATGRLRATDPELLALERETAGLRARARVPADLVFLEGHFPGHPLVPGFVQVHWVMELARRELAVASPPAAIEVLKFRAPLLPEQAFEIGLRASPRRLDFELTRDGQAVSSGRIQLDDGVPQHRSEPAPAASAAPALPLRLPHQGRMRVLERVLAHEPPVTLCEARIGTSTPLCVESSAPAWLGIEILAQGMAAQAGLDPRGHAFRGFLTGARRVELRTRAFRAGETLWVRAEHLRGDLGMVALRCALGSGAPPVSGAEAEARALVQGTLSAFVEATGE